MIFREVAEVFNHIEQISSRLEITQNLAALIKRTTGEQVQMIAYLTLGELNPTYVGTQFNFAEKSMLKLLAQLLEKDVEQVKALVRKHGDAGLLLEELASVHQPHHELTVVSVYERLKEFHDIEGTGSQELKEQCLLELLKSLDHVSAKYVVRIVLGKLRLGFSDMTLLDACSWMMTGDKSLRKALEEAYNISADIGLIARVLKDDGIDAIKAMEIIPGIPIRPAAAERMNDPYEIYAKLSHCVAQPKLDGFRLQVHKYQEREKTVIRFFSRNLQEMSHMFPDLYAAVAELPMKTLVAEGEAIAYELETGSFLPFQETVKRRRKHDIDNVAQDFPLRLYLFDLLYYDGTSMLKLTHADRRKKLETIAPIQHEEKHDSVLFVIEEKVIDNGQQLETYFKEVVSLGLEGLIVRKIDAVYQAGKRNFNWIKLKRQEFGQLDDSIDCVILGYYAGRGKRAGFGIGALLVGVYNPEVDMFQTVAKIGTGLSDEEWRAQKKACDAIKVEHKPSNVDCARELYPHVWVNPELVCMIRADEITVSPLHRARINDEGDTYALRFPRLMGYRPDKAAIDATTSHELVELFDHQKRHGEKEFEKKSD